MTTRMIIPLVFGLVGAAILASLGTWQLQRLNWKTTVLANIDRAILSAPGPIMAVPSQDADQYLPVRAMGTITEDEITILASTKKIGAAYRIISVFETDDRRLLLDRGFVPLTDKDAPRPATDITVVGNLYWPDEVNESTPKPDLERNIWFARDIPLMAKALNTEPVLVVARDATDPAITPFPVDSSAIPNNHLEYVLTWYGLAIVWLGMTGYFLWRMRRKA